MLQRSCVAQQSWGYGVFVFFTSWRPIGLGMLTKWKNTCRSPVWSYARMGDSFSACRLAAGRASSSPEQQKLCHTWLPHARLLGECHPPLWPRASRWELITFLVLESLLLKNDRNTKMEKVFEGRKMHGITLSDQVSEIIMCLSLTLARDIQTEPELWWCYQQAFWGTDKQHK